MIDSLKNQHADVRVQAASLLAQRNFHKHVVFSLLDALKDSNTQVRNQAFWALQMVPAEPRTMLVPLQGMLKDGDSTQTVQAVQILVRCGDKAGVLLQKALGDKDSNVRNVALNSLCQITGDPTSCCRLSRLDEDFSPGTPDGCRQPQPLRQG